MSWAKKFSKPYRVEHGKKFRFKDHDPADTAKLHSQEHAEELLAKGVARMAELQDKLYAQDRWAPAAHLPGHGRRRKGRRHQARDVRRQSAGLPGVLLQGALRARNWTTIISGAPRAPARARPHRHLQPLVLRRSAGRPRPSGDPGERRNSRRSWSRRTSGTSASRTFAASSATSPATASSSASSSSMCRGRSRRSAFSSGCDKPEKNWKFSAADVQERECWDDYRTPTKT